MKERIESTERYVQSFYRKVRTENLQKGTCRESTERYVQRIYRKVRAENLQKGTYRESTESRME